MNDQKIGVEGMAESYPKMGGSMRFPPFVADSCAQMPARVQFAARSVKI
jgi:hypothetical protein